MILPFSLELNGKPTFFVEKITQGLLRNKYVSEEVKKAMAEYEWPKNESYQHPWSCRKDLKDKIHTIRVDDRKRWHSNGLDIHFAVNNRSKKYWQFAPVIPVVSTQIIEMSWSDRVLCVWVNNRLLDKEEILQLAINDGFESEAEFIEAFASIHGEDFFIGKIIHWTNFKY